jgi:flagellar export protein FliJ
MAYTFRFQRLLDHKGRVVQEREQALARQQQELMRLQHRLRTLEGERELLMSHMQATLLGRLRPDQVDQSYRYLGSLGSRIDDQKEQVRLCLAAVEERRQALAAALQERSTLEKIEENDRAAFMQELNRQEAAALDDLNIARFRRLQQQGRRTNGTVTGRLPIRHGGTD